MGKTMFNNIFNIWQKELMDVIRDKKGLRQTLLIPLILGVFYAIINPLLGSLGSSQAEKELVIPVQGLEHAGAAFVEIFSSYDIVLQPFEGDIETAVQSGAEPAGLIFTQGFGESIANEEPATLIVRTNSTSGGPFGGSISLNRLELAMNAFNQSVTVQRLQVRAIDPEQVLAPVLLDIEDVATPAQRAGATAAFFLPILIAISAVQGGQFIAIDVTAGEKERGTLEALLVTPASDVEIFIGKLLAVFVVTAVPIVLTLLGFWGTTLVLPESMMEGAGALPLNTILKAIVVTLPLALFTNVILMIVSIRTKAFKDAQSALTPVVFVTMFTAMAAAFVPPQNSLMFLIPIYGTSALVGSFTIGGIIPTNAILFSTVGSLIAAFIGIVIALRMFNRERLLYSM
jgi:sodium transport system permease protein